MSSAAFPADLVTLGHFPQGWGWEAQLRGYISKKYRQDLAGLKDLPPAAVAACLGGVLVPQRPYDTICWILRVRPFRPLDLYFFFTVDPEFGTDLRVFCSRLSLALPTEDVYVFAWDYVALLARYGRGTWPLALTPGGDSWVALAEIESSAGAALERFTLQGRRQVLLLLRGEVVQTALWRLDCGQPQTLANGWSITWQVLPDLQLRVLRDDSGLVIAYEKNGASKYGPEFLCSFAWLYLNALLRQARQVDPDLPQLSAYF